METSDALPAGGSRVCRPCTACCTRLPIPAGVIGPRRKPAREDCPHLGAAACNVYPPPYKACLDFCCAWLGNRDWAEAWRPDRSGLLCLREEIEAGLPAAAVYEIRPGALQEPAAVEIIAALKRTTVVIALVDGQRRRRCLLGERLVHAGHPGPSRPHFLGRQGLRPGGPNCPAATSYRSVVSLRTMAGRIPSLR